MFKVPIGSRVKPLGINRLDCSEGSRIRCVLVDPNPRAKYVAFDETVRRIVEVDEEMIINYGLSPYTNYYYLVAKLNTDMQGNIVDDKFTVEYLQLSETRNNEFSDHINEMGSFKTLSITKVSKKTEKGDFSYLNVTPSNQEAPKAVLDKIQQLLSNPKNIDTMWGFVDAATSITKEQYIKLLNNEAPNATALNRVADSSPALSQNTYMPTADSFSSPQPARPIQQPTQTAPQQPVQTAPQQPVQTAPQQPAQPIQTAPKQPAQPIQTAPQQPVQQDNLFGSTDEDPFADFELPF